MNANTPGRVAALADNPGCADLIAALAAEPACPFASVEPAVRAAIRRRAARAAWLRRAGGSVLAAVAAVAVAVLSAPPTQPLPTPSTSSTLSTPSTFSTRLLARQREDGSWAADRGGEANAPAATALAMLELAAGAKDDPAAAASLARGAAWLRAHQNPDGSFGAAPADSAAGAWNLALGATALLRLYEAGGHSDLFTPIDGAVGALRARLARPAGAAASRQAELQLASALALADALEWPDEHAGDLRRAMRRLGAEGESFAAKRDALARLAGRI